MIELPGVCDSCGAIFGSSIFVPDGGSADSTGTTVGPCPRCGAMGHVPDGTYEVLGNVVTVAAANAWSQSRLAHLITTLEGARAQRVSGQEAAARITDEAPELKSFIDRVASARGVAVVALLTLLIQLLSTLHDYTGSGIDEAESRRLVEEAVTACMVAGPPTAPVVNPAREQDRRDTETRQHQERSSVDRRRAQRKSKARQARQSRRQNRRRK